MLLLLDWKVFFALCCIFDADRPGYGYGALNESHVSGGAVGKTEGGVVDTNPGIEGICVGWLVLFLVFWISISFGDDVLNPTYNSYCLVMKKTC
jgi:hypothetical protein